MKESKPLLLLASGGMELSWRYAWATFLTTSILHHPFPFPEAVVTFALAAALTSIYHERGWRVILILCIQLLGFIPAAWRVIHVFNSWSGSFLSLAYKSYTSSFDQRGIPLEWIIVVLFILWGFFFWGGGVGMAKRPRDYATICSRFDMGLGSLFFLYLVKFYLFMIGAKRLTDSSAEFLLFSFFLFGLLAIGLARTRNEETKDFIPGYRGLAVILNFIMMVLLVGAGLIFFALPYLTGAAKIGYGVIKGASGPLLSIFMKVINFLFGGKYSVSDVERPPVKKTVAESSPDLDIWWLKLLGEILTWVVLILLGLIFLTIFCVTVYSLVRWLFSKTSAGHEKRSLWDFLPLWAIKLGSLLRFCRRAMAGRMNVYRGAVQLYASLLIWGRRSGLPRTLSETPAEYGSRLKYRFPVREREIGLIVESFNREVYGEMALNEQQLAVARFAFRRLRSPSLWFLRLKSWVRRSTDRDCAFP
ncbi:MAG: DUF4129 domain-containing protein [Deltaproteobacteria bacterium]|nr:DUF4129 domain-containing protein [Deltaproteobacteria bacterium]